MFLHNRMILASVGGGEYRCFCFQYNVLLEVESTDTDLEVAAPGSDGGSPALATEYDETFGVKPKHQ